MVIKEVSEICSTSIAASCMCINNKKVYWMICLLSYSTFIVVGEVYDGYVNSFV